MTRVERAHSMLKALETTIILHRLKAKCVGLEVIETSFYAYQAYVLPLNYSPLVSVRRAGLEPAWTITLFSA